VSEFVLGLPKVHSTAGQEIFRSSPRVMFKPKRLVLGGELVGHVIEIVLKVEGRIQELPSILGKDYTAHAKPIFLDLHTIRPGEWVELHCKNNIQATDTFVQAALIGT